MTVPETPAQTVMVLPCVEAPGLDEAFLPQAQWQGLPGYHFVRAERGDTPARQTTLRTAWSVRGLHICFRCDDPTPLNRDFADDTPIEEDERVGVFLDPSGERSQYMTIFASPYGRVAGARVENPLHHTLQSEVDETWQCPGVRVRSWSRHTEWWVEMLIPYTGITPAIDPPSHGDRWTGNFYRLEYHPTPEITAWQPVYGNPPDLHSSDHFGVLEFG